MTPDVQTRLDGLKRVVSVRNEAELARRLGVNQSAISSWKQRGRVPQRFARMVSEPEVGMLADLRGVSGGLQEQGFPIGLVRFAVLRADLLQSGNADDAMSKMRDMLPFWLVMYRAVHDLLKRVEVAQVDLTTAQALILQDDLRDPSATRSRVEAQLAEDIADNPHLRSAYPKVDV
jgi:hypothetical protein